MSTHSPSTAIIGALLVSTLATGPRAQDMSASTIHVGPNVHVSSSHAAWAHFETWLAADPKDSKHLLGGSVVFNPEAAKYESFAYASFDGGASWVETMHADEGWMDADPATTYGPDGSAYYVKAPLSRPGPSELKIYRSKDAGRTWLAPTRLPWLDREAATFDMTDGRFRGRLYVQGTDHGDRSDGEDSISITLYASTDDGATFLPPARLSIPETNVPLIVGNNVVTSKGTLVLPFAHHAPRRTDERAALRRGTIEVTTSTDGGLSLTRPVVVGPLLISYGPGLPWIAVDATSGPFAGRLYVAWTTWLDGRDQAVLSHSADEGRSWSKPVVVNDDRARTPPAEGPNHARPLVAVNDKGVVGVVWYDRREFAENIGFHVRFAASFDGGETFTPSVQVAEQPYAFTPNTPLPIDAWGRVRDGDLSIDIGPAQFLTNAGDTTGFAASADGVFHPFWIDNRTGVPQVWTTGVMVSGAAVRNGAPELSSLDDVTARLSVDLSNVRYDDGHHRLTATITLKNTSDRPIGGPIQVRVLEAKCGQGRAVIMNADNKLAGAGAIWRVAEKLSPGEASAARTLEFEIAEPLPFDVKRLGAFDDLVNLRARVYGSQQ